MSSLEKAIYSELQARVLDNQYRPNPLEQKALHGCQSRALRNAFLGGFGAVALTFLILPGRATSNRSGGTIMVRSFMNRWKMGRNVEHGSTGSSRETPLDVLRDSAQPNAADATGSRFESATHRRTAKSTSEKISAGHVARNPVFLRRGVVASVGAILGAYYGAQTTGTHCLEDILGLGDSSAMANEIRIILADIAAVGASRGEEWNAQVDGDAERLSEEDDVSLSDSMDRDGKQSSLDQQGGQSSLTASTRRLLGGSVTRADVEEWIKKHDCSAAEMGVLRTSTMRPDGEWTDLEKNASTGTLDTTNDVGWDAPLPNVQNAPPISESNATNFAQNRGHASESVRDDVTDTRVTPRVGPSRRTRRTRLSLEQPKKPTEQRADENSSDSNASPTSQT